MRAILLFFAPRILAWLEGALDPDLAAKWQAIKAREKELDEAHVALDLKETELRVRLAESERLQADWQRQIEAVDRAIAEDEAKLKASAQRRREIDEDLKQALADVDARDPDLERERPLPTG